MRAPCRTPVAREETNSTAEQAMSIDILLDQPHINNSPAHFQNYHTTRSSRLCQASGRYTGNVANQSSSEKQTVNLATQQLQVVSVDFFLHQRVNSKCTWLTKSSKRGERVLSLISVFLLFMSRPTKDLTVDTLKYVPTLHNRQ